MTNKISILRLAVHAGFLLSLATTAFAQSNTGTIRGTVLDPSGALIPRAQVTVSNTTGFSRTMKSSPAGTFVIPHLAPGNYSISIDATGLATMKAVTNKAIALLHAHSSERQDRIFPVTANAFQLAWRRVKARAKIDDLRFHDLRHEAISKFFELGLTTPEVAMISGHRDMRMLFRYAHADRSRVLEKINLATS